MRCPACGAAAPDRARFCPNCGTAMQAQPGGISTGGGAYVGGSVQTGGDFVGRDQQIAGGYTRVTRQGLTGEELGVLFRDVYRQIDLHPRDPEVDTEQLKQTAKQVEQEAAKGSEADPDKVKKWLHTLGKLAPDVLEVVVNALTNPAAGVASAVRLVAEQIRARVG